VEMFVKGAPLVYNRNRASGTRQEEARI
jgi:hypothetical protein